MVGRTFVTVKLGGLRRLCCNKAVFFILGWHHALKQIPIAALTHLVFTCASAAASASPPSRDQSAPDSLFYL